MYQLIKNSFKTPIQPTNTKLNTVDGSPMTALGMTVLHLRITDFKFTHNFVICNRLPDTEIFFGIDVQNGDAEHVSLKSLTCCTIPRSKIGTGKNKGRTEPWH